MFIRFIKDLSLMLVLAVILLAAVNAGAWVFLKSALADNRGWGAKLQIAPDTPRGMNLRKTVFATDDEDYLRMLEDEPGIRPHTVLHFTNGFSTPAYTIGVEGIRYEDGWTDEFVMEQLDSGESVFVFGGSTTIGQGVDNNTNVVASLAAEDAGSVYLNFGINAYDSLREVDKLLYLLRQGYRPKRVIFIDGLNDATTFASSPYRAIDKPRPQGFLSDRGEPALIFGLPVLDNMLLAFAYAMPVTHLYFYLNSVDPAIPYGSMDANADDLDYRLISYYHLNKFEYSAANIDLIIAEWLDHYGRNIEFVRGLGQTFDFESYFVFQPFGVTDPDNPFLTEKHFSSPGALTAERFVGSAVAAINDGQLDAIDCHDVLEKEDSAYMYVDATHYSPRANQVLAKCILAGTGPAGDIP